MSFVLRGRKARTDPSRSLGACAELMDDETRIDDSGNEDAENGTWSRRDVWMGLLFLFKSALLATLIFSIYRNGFSLIVCIPAGFLCVLFLLLGANATIRSLTSGR